MMLKIITSLVIILLLETRCEGQEIEDFQPDIAVMVHNDFRRSEGSSNMKALLWDEKLANETADYARQCDFAHAPNVPHGENIQITSKAFDSSTLERAITAWYNEKNDYNFSTNTCALGKKCGHYTQVVWANSERVGCAAATCSSITNGFENDAGGTLVFCRYSPAGNVRGQSPMKKGASCSECESGWDCDDGLCVPETMEPTKSTQPLPKSTTAEPSRSNSTTKGVTTPGKMSTTEEPMATKPQFTSPKSTVTVKPPYTTESPTSTASPPQFSCSEQYYRTLRDYNALLEDYKREFNKWKDMTSESSCSQNY